MMSKLQTIANKSSVIGTFLAGASIIFHIGKSSDQIDHLSNRIYAYEKEQSHVLESLQDIRERMIATEKGVNNIEKNITRIEQNVSSIDNDVKKIIINRLT
jgi:hypothetical protein